MAADHVTVLCVDDDDDLVSLTASYLEKADDGFDVITETDPEDALETIHREAVDCVISDYDMPIMDGLALLEAVREARPDLPFILFTGKGSEEVASEAIAKGVTDYLQKDTGYEQYELLANRARNVVEQRRANERAASLDRIRSILRDVNQTLVRSTDRGRIEQRVCEIIVDADPYRLAWIAETGARSDRLEPRAVAGATEIDDIATEILDLEATDDVCPVREAIVSGDIETEPLPEVDAAETPRTELLAQRGYRSGAALPIQYDETKYGVLCLYAEQPNAFDWRERELLAEVGGDLAHAIYRIELYERQQRFKRIISNVPEGVYRNSPLPDGTLIEVNPALVKLFDAGEESELIGRPFRDLYADPTDREQFTSALKRDGIVRDMELRLETLTGEEFWASVTGILTEESGDRYFDGVIRDVTERRERQRKLQQYKNIFNISPLGIFRTSSDGSVHEVNQKMAEILGFEDTAEIRETYTDLYEDLYVDREKRENFISQLATEGTVRNFVYDAMTKTGDIVTLSMSATVFDGSTDRPFDIVGYVRPVEQASVSR